MLVVISIVKRGTSLNDFVWKKSQWIEIMKNIHGWGWSLIITEQFFILWHFLVLNTYSEGCWEFDWDVNLCRVFRWWCFMEYIPEPSVLVLGQKVQLICHPQDAPTLQLKKRIKALPEMLGALAYPLPLYNHSGIWEDTWSEKAI